MLHRVIFCAFTALFLNMYDLFGAPACKIILSYRIVFLFDQKAAERYGTSTKTLFKLLSLSPSRSYILSKCATNHLEHHDHTKIVPRNKRSKIVVMLIKCPSVHSRIVLCSTRCFHISFHHPEVLIMDEVVYHSLLRFQDVSINISYQWQIQRGNGWPPLWSHHSIYDPAVHSVWFIYSKLAAAQIHWAVGNLQLETVGNLSKPI